MQAWVSCSGVGQLLLVHTPWVAISLVSSAARPQAQHNNGNGEDMNATAPVQGLAEVITGNCVTSAIEMSRGRRYRSR